MTEPRYIALIRERSWKAAAAELSGIKDKTLQLHCLKQFCERVPALFNTIPLATNGHAGWLAEQGLIACALDLAGATPTEDGK